MIGKVKAKYKILFVIVAILSTIVCLSFGIRNEKTTFASANSVEIDGQEYSAKFDGDIIFTVEKVTIDAPNKDLIYSYGSGESSVFDAENNAKKFTNIQNGTNKKTVVKDNSFVKLNNKLNNEVYTTANNANKSEAIMISFGQYVYSQTTKEDGTVTESVASPKLALEQKDEQNIKTNKDVSAGITNLESATMFHDGETTNLRTKGLLRSIYVAGVGYYYDFAYFITQEEGNDGYYRFDFKDYLIKGEKFSASFEFYVVFDSSYAEEVEENGYRYSTAPTLGWSEGENGYQAKTDDVNGYVRYFIGNSGIESNGNISYPMITYDYAKWSLSYIHTANYKKTTYTYSFDPKNVTEDVNGTVKSAYITITVESGEDVYTMTKEVKYSKTGSNIATIILTKPGTYVFDYGYIYTGYNRETAPEMNLTINGDGLAKNLSIHGFELEYSKYGYTEAELKSVTIANNKSSIVSLIVPNGQTNEEIDSLKNNALGFVYEIDEESTARVGTITDVSQGLLNNTTITTLTINETGNTDKLDILENTALENTAFELPEITYTKTNQGSLWFKYNDTFEDSFYYYSPTEITKDSLFKKDDDGNDVTTALAYTTETSFNQTGYYLVFIKVLPNGYVENNVQKYYWQVFAFQYSTDTIEMTVETVETDETTPVTVGAGKYTNKDVLVSWDEPTVFERKVTGYYYTTTNVKYSIKQILSNSDVTRYDLPNSKLEKKPIGSEVKDGQYLKYLLVLNSEGGSATYRLLTIDRQNIQGVTAYAVTKMNVSGGGSYYTQAVNVNNNPIVIDNGIIDSWATLSWEDSNNGYKSSGASIHATYTYTPFVRNTNTITITSITHNANTWYTTNYQLGETIGNFDFERATNKTDINYYTSLISDAGIYLFTLTDDAGNSCKYMLVIDDTEAYFRVGDIYYTNDYQLYTTSTTINVGSHKAISLGSEKLNSDLANIITNLYNKEKLKENNYYLENNSNYQALQKLFTYSTNNSKYYLTVKNNALEVYDKNLIETKAINGETSYTLEFDKDSKSTSTIRTFYIVGENNRYSERVRTNNAPSDSYFKVEINPDNSQGMVFAIYDNIENIDFSKLNFNSDNRIITGSDIKDEVGSGLTEAGASSAKYFTFTWNIGTGVYIVDSITYDYYTLNTDSYDDKSPYYFYKHSEKVVAYEGATVKDKDTTSIENGTKGVMKLYIDNNGTQAGLYVVTRTYSADSGFGENDAKTKNYYFIVDRYGIYEVTNNVGNNIGINVLDREETFSEFNNTASDIPITVNGKNYNYKIYLTSNKVPLTLNVPVGKYMTNTDGQNSSGYDAGRLKYTLMFINTEVQVYERSDIEVILATGEVNEYTTDGYAKIDISSNLAGANGVATTNLMSRFIVHEDNKDWLALPGTYVLILEDNVYTNTDKETHHFAIGFEIKKNYNKPTVDIESGANANNTQRISDDTTIYTSDEYVRYKLPEYLDNEFTNPQVDPNYILVEQNYNGNNKIYLKYEYSINGSEYNNAQLDQNVFTDGIKDILEIVDGDRYIYLDTKVVRDENGNIDITKSSLPLSYTITVRYRVSIDGNSDSLKDAYYYYTDHQTNERIYYYDRTYTIIIDRTPPINNVTKLINNDTIVTKYNEEYNNGALFEVNYWNTGSKIYYTRQYNAYYDSTSLSKSKYIYAFRVDSTTTLDKEDIDTIYYNRIIDESTISLSLPVTSSTNSVSMSDLKKETYIGLLGDIASGYYEIVEIDKAGNATQYVIYMENDVDDNIEISFKDKESTVTLSNNSKDSSVTMFSVEANENSSSIKGNLFYRITLDKQGSNVLAINTNFSTVTSNLSTEIASKINELGHGNYKLTITDQSGNTNTLEIHYLADKTPETQLNIDGIIKSEGDKYYIDLHGANKTVNNVNYYATEIKIISSNSTRIFTYNDGEYLDKEDKRFARIDCTNNVTYVIELVDLFGTKYRKNFNSNGSTIFHSIDLGGRGYQSENGHYYAFGDVSIWYDTTVYGAGDIVVTGINDDEYTIENGIITIKANDDKKIDVSVTFSKDKTTEGVYNVTIDRNVGNVSLNNTTTGTSQSSYMKRAYNTDYKNVTVENSITGSMNLTWDNLYNTYFQYEYRLYELRKDEEYYETVLNGTNMIINTQDYSQGRYWFVISVYSNNIERKLLGNKVFAFDVQQSSSTLYTVRIGQNAIEANSTFTLNDIQEITGGQSTASYPLYICNEVPSVVFTNDVERESKVKINNVLTLYSITYPYKTYFAVMVMPESNEILSDMRLTTISTIVDDNGVSTDRTLIVPITSEDNTLDAVGDLTAKVSLSGKQISHKINGVINWDDMLNKNTLTVEIYYNNTLVKSVPYGNDFDLGILGNGIYEFRILDLAGNVQKFTGDDNKLTVNVLREVFVTINEEAPIYNAYYNSGVVMKVMATNKYVTGSVNIEATRDGMEYKISSNTHTFTEYGTYRVIVSAKYFDGENTYDISKTISFTIINEKEARQSIDLTNLGGYEITKVILDPKNRNIDCTKLFINEMVNMNIPTGMLLSYDIIIEEFKEKLNISSGKQTFEITYKVVDQDTKMYPDREVTFSFTLNNEMPKIECSISSGESTNEGFNVKFNAGAIYEQIGASYVKIGDKIIEINDKSSYAQQSIYTSFDNDGAGDYYIQLVSSSGAILSSMKVTITEPLNTWAIILIVVVVAVVITVTVVIIVLRHKMRIR